MDEARHPGIIHFSYPVLRDISAFSTLVLVAYWSVSKKRTMLGRLKLLLAHKVMRTSCSGDVRGVLIRFSFLKCYFMLPLHVY